MITLQGTPTDVRSFNNGIARRLEMVIATDGSDPKVQASPQMRLELPTISPDDVGTLTAAMAADGQRLVRVTIEVIEKTAA